MMTVKFDMSEYRWRQKEKERMMDIDELKAQWLADPIWDIEDTEGFEAHREELLAFRLEKEARWEQLRSETVQLKAMQLKCSPELAEYLVELESRLGI